MTREHDASLSEEEHVWMAEQAVDELYGLAGWARVLMPARYLIFSDHVARVINSLRKEWCREAIMPVTAYLIHVPLLDGSGNTQSTYTAPKPATHIIEAAVDFLAWMGDPQAFRALRRIASKYRNIPTESHAGQYEDAANDQERAHAEWAMKMIDAVQSQGYRICQSCNGQGRNACHTCKGLGTVKKRYLLWNRKRRCPECYGAMSIECSNCSGFGRLLPTL
jgi:hypothetical protein